jgi:CheY-like chemotaxis protein
VARILCIEDDPGIYDLLRLILEGAGYTFLGARDGAEGLEKMREGHPDLVLMALMLPNVGGAEVLFRKQGDSVVRDIPVIAVTALPGSCHHLMWKRRIEIEHVVAKPFARRHLLETVEQALAGREKTAEM